MHCNGGIEMKITRKIMVLFLLIISSLLFACTSATPNHQQMQLTSEELEAIDQAKGQVIVIGVYDGDDTSNYIFNLVEAKFGLQFTYQTYSSFFELFQAVVDGDIDFVSNITKTEERALILDFSAPVSYESLYLYTRDYNQIDDFSGKTIAVQKGTVIEDTVPTYLVDSTIISYENDTEFWDLLENDNVDGVINNDIFLDMAYENGFDAYLINNIIPTKSVSVVSQIGKNTYLLSAFSKYFNTKEYIETIQLFQSSKNHDIMIEHLKDLVDQTIGTDEKKITIKYENNSPYAIYNSDGSISGVFPDILNEACELLEMNCVIESNASESWASMYQDLLDSKIDALVPVTWSQERDEILNFSDQVVNSSYFMVKRVGYTTNYTDLYQLVFERIGIIDQDIKSQILTEQFPSKEFLYYETNNDLIQGLLDGEVDYIMLSDIVYYQYVIDHNNFSMEIDDAIDPLLWSGICIAFPDTEKGNMLQHMFDEAISMINTDEISSKYLAQSNLLSYYQSYKNFSITTMVFLSSTIIILGFLVWLSLRSNQKLKFASEHDFMTGLLDRRGFMNRLTKINLHNDLTILYFDLDNFKYYNDLRGHETGDQILIELAKRLKGLISDQVVTSRFGGDEFIILTTFKSQQEIDHLVGDINDILSKKIIIDQFTCNLSASIGICQCQSGTTYDEMLEKAELAMRKAKENDYTKIVYYNPTFGEMKKQEINMVDTLKNCIENDGFEMVYQPIVNSENNHIVGLEALLRIKGSKISPAVFIRIAEKNGLMNKIGRIVIRKVFMQVSMWKNENLPIVPTFINFSATQLHDETIGEYISRLLEEFNVEGKYFGIEITEDVFLDRKELVIDTLMKVKELGLVTAIDDFGAGQAGVNYLTNFEVEIVKIGKEVADKYLNKEKAMVYSTVVNLCYAMGFSIISEGIETSEQLSFLTTMNVNQIQGYYFFRPMHVDQIEGLLNNPNYMSISLKQTESK